MATSTISIPALTDDTGTYLAPNGDGTALNNAWFQSTLGPAINAIWASAGFTVAGGMIWEGAGVNAINDTTNGNMTTGLTINQGAADNEILCLKSSDVAHGITTYTETDTFALFSKVQAASGGLLVRCFTEDTIGIMLDGFATNVDTTKGIGAIGALYLNGYKKSGTAGASLGANANILAVTDNGTTRFILDADGDSHQDIGTAWTNFDDHEDAELLTAFSAAVSREDDPIRQQFGSLIEAHRDTLARARIVTFNEDQHHFVNWSRMSMLMVGAIRQTAARLAALERRLPA